ncbi:MAG TPA: LptA/OstA family protein [Candidatus Limnocylindrales bacterium]|nr:LptA/OstA family protein [Candidatus Limnocylindrales bacterium]
MPSVFPLLKRPLALLICGAALVFSLASAQNFGEIKGLKLADPYGPPHETQIKSLLQAAKARRLPDGHFLCTDAKVQTFAESGQGELVVNAPECYAASGGEWAHSAGPLRLETADGKFSLEGEGFLWQQTNSDLMISNRVHTVIHQSLIEPGPAGSSTQAPESKANGIEIFSRQFQYQKKTGLGVYRGNVHVVGTNFSLASEVLTVELPMNERRLQSITAEENVIVDYTNIHATANRAVYATDTGLIHLTGNPRWISERREGSADELVIDRTNRIFQAERNAWLKIPAQQQASMSFFGQPTNAPVTQGVATNQFIEVRSDRYEFRTNSARFWQHVNLKQWSGENLRGTMTCSQMSVTFSGTNELQNLVAETNVVIADDERRLTGNKAVYTGTNGWLELTENPTWKDGAREGRGDLLRVHSQPQEMQVRGHGYLRLPADELGQSIALSGSTAPKATPTKATQNQFGEIWCEDYTLKPDLAIFEGDVRARHPQMNWVCKRLTIRSWADAGKVLVAEDAVDFTLIDDKGIIHGTGDNVVYTNWVSGTITNDVMHLRGRPATLSMTNTLVTNPSIILDRASGTLSAPGGEYKITGTMKGADTNMFRLPKNRNSQ